MDARDLDQFIGEKIMGWRVIPETKSYIPQRGGEGTVPDIPRFSMDDSTYAILKPRVEELGAKVIVHEQRKRYSPVQMYNCRLRVQRCFLHQRQTRTEEHGNL
jgi:hypothetical protein